MDASFDDFLHALRRHYARYTPAAAEAECGVPREKIVEIAREIGRAGSAFATHVWRNAASGNLGGWQVARCLEFLSVLVGAIATRGGTNLNTQDKFVPPPFLKPPAQGVWNELLYPREYPLAHHELSYLLPHFLTEKRGKLAAYFTRVYNPVWTNPDGMMWERVLRDESKIELHAALTPVWSETAQYADFVLPMGVGAERHDLMSQETHAAKWIGFRQPVVRRAKEKLGQKVDWTWQANPGEVWEEDEFWIALSWRIDPDGKLGVRRWFESPYRPGHPIAVDEYYRWIFENSVPGLPEEAKKHGLSPLEYMKTFGAFLVQAETYEGFRRKLSTAELAGVTVDEARALLVRTAADPGPASPRSGGEAAPPSARPGPNAPMDGRTETTGSIGSRAGPDAGMPQEVGRSAPSRSLPRSTTAALHGDTPVGVVADGEARVGLNTPSRRFELFSSTMVEWGWPEQALPGYIESHVHRRHLDPAKGEFVLVPTFRLPTLIHTRSGNSKWLYELSNSNPVWVHPEDAARLGVKLLDLVRVTTRIGHFVNKVWVTEGVRPGVVACSHHLGRWRLFEDVGTDRWASALVAREELAPGRFRFRRVADIRPWKSSDPDSGRVWWSDGGVHQNLTFPVQPDPISGMHCWHQRVRVEPARPDDRYADVEVDTNRSMAVYREWLALARPARGPLRRPRWLNRAVRPAPEAYALDPPRP